MSRGDETKLLLWNLVCEAGHISPGEGKLTCDAVHAMNAEQRAPKCPECGGRCYGVPVILRSIDPTRREEPTR